MSPHHVGVAGVGPQTALRRDVRLLLCGKPKTPCAVASTKAWQRTYQLLPATPRYSCFHSTLLLIFSPPWQTQQVTLA